MNGADTSMPSEDPGTLPKDQETGGHDLGKEPGVEGNAQPEPDSSLPPEEDDPEVKDTEQQPT